MHSLSDLTFFDSRNSCPKYRLWRSWPCSSVYRPNFHRCMQLIPIRGYYCSTKLHSPHRDRGDWHRRSNTPSCCCKEPRACFHSLRSPRLCFFPLSMDCRPGTRRWGPCTSFTSCIEGLWSHSKVWWSYQWILPREICHSWRRPHRTSWTYPSSLRSKPPPGSSASICEGWWTSFQR